MPAPIKSQSAIRGPAASTAGGSPTIQDSDSQLQGARPVPVPSVLANQNTSPSVSTSNYTPDLHGVQVRQEVPSLLLKEDFLVGEKKKTTEPISVSYCMQLLKNLHRDACSSNSIEDDNGIHEHLAEIVSDKNTALSEAAKLEQQSPRLALFMYKLMEHISPDVIASLRIDNNVLHKQPEVCALLAATLQGRFEIAKALAKNGGDAARLHQQLLEMDRYQLRQLLPLLQHDHAWATKHLSHLKEMDEDQLQYLLPLLQHDKAWTTEHLSHFKKMSEYKLQSLLQLLQHDQAWTNANFPTLHKMDGHQLKHLFPLVQHDKAWATHHLHLLKDVGEHQLKHLLPLVRHDQVWTTEHFPLLKAMDGRQLKHLLPLVQHERAWTTTYLPILKAIDENQLQKLLLLLKQNLQEITVDKYCQLLLGITHRLLSYDPNQETAALRESLLRFFHLRLMDISSEGFTSAANPYVREALSMHNQDVEELTKVLQTHGASRSTFHPEKDIASYLTEKFKTNSQKIPGATFGMENEMFIPGIPESTGSEVENKLNERLGIKNKEYRYVEEISLSTDAPFATPPIEQVTSILHSPEDIQRLQSVLSILNDWGAFTNDTAGVHIHTGIKQWKAADCLNTLEEKSKNRFLHQWDQDLPKQFLGTTITPYQLLFMKQFLVNMVAMQKDFYLVARKSLYSKPNGPISENDLDQYYQNVSRARDYQELLSSTDVDDRDLNVNLIAYQLHGTIEVRGFTKKNSDHMEVDPNLPVRDLIFMQDVLIKVLHDTKNILLSGASPDDRIEVRPSTGLTEILKEYVQDVFLLEIIHALGQRNPEQRVETMEAIVEDKDLIASETLQKIRESQATLLEGDRLAQHFLAALNGDAQWAPFFVERTPLKRINSLRSMADAGLSGHE